jgi:hypothetical protein
MSKRNPARRLTRTARARTGYFAGLVLIASGLWLALGLGWGLIAAGAGVIAYFALLYDVDEPLPYDNEEAGVRYR